MLILPHALHCVDRCIFLYLTSTDTVLHTVFGVNALLLLSTHTHTHTHTNIFFSNLDFSLSKFTGELKIRVKGFVLKRLLTYIEMLIVCVCVSRDLAAEKHKNYSHRLRC